MHFKRKCWQELEESWLHYLLIDDETYFSWSSFQRNYKQALYCRVDKREEGAIPPQPHYLRSTQKKKLLNPGNNNLNLGRSEIRDIIPILCRK